MARAPRIERAGKPVSHHLPRLQNRMGGGDTLKIGLRKERKKNGFGLGRALILISKTFPERSLGMPWEHAVTAIGTSAGRHPKLETYGVAGAPAGIPTLAQHWPNRGFLHHPKHRDMVHQGLVVSKAPAWIRCCSHGCSRIFRSPSTLGPTGPNIDNSHGSSSKLAPFRSSSQGSAQTSSKSATII